MLRSASSVNPASAGTRAPGARVSRARHPKRYQRVHPTHRHTYFEAPRPRPMGERLKPFGRREDGSRYFVEVHLQRMEYEGSPGFVAIILDTTKRKAAEDALRESYERLEQRVIERTVALHEAKLEAEKANNSKTRFLAAASHDLRPVQAAI